MPDAALCPYCGLALERHTYVSRTTCVVADVTEVRVNAELDAEEFEGGYPWPNL